MLGKFAAVLSRLRFVNSLRSVYEIPGPLFMRRHAGTLNADWKCVGHVCACNLKIQFNSIRLNIDGLDVRYRDHACTPRPCWLNSDAIYTYIRIRTNGHVYCACPRGFSHTSDTLSITQALLYCWSAWVCDHLRMHDDANSEPLYMMHEHTGGCQKQLKRIAHMISEVHIWRANHKKSVHTTYTLTIEILPSMAHICQYQYQ